MIAKTKASKLAQRTIAALLPHQFRWEICDECEGNGRHSAHLGDFSEEDLADDPEFAEDYFAGRYDCACGSCGGSGKIRAIRPGALGMAQLRILAAARIEAREMREAALEAEAERRMGA